MTFDHPSAAPGSGSPALMTVTFRVHRFEPYSADPYSADSSNADIPTANSTGTTAASQATSNATSAEVAPSPTERPRRHHASPFAKIDARREAAQDDGSRLDASTTSAASTPSAPRAASRPAHRAHVSPFAKIDAKRESEAEQPATSSAAAEASTAANAAAPRPVRRAHVSPFAKIDAKREAEAEQTTQAVPSAGTTPTARPARRPHTSPFARIDAKREAEAAQSAEGAQVARPARRPHTSPFARIDAKRTADAENRVAKATTASTTPLASAPTQSVSASRPSTSSSTSPASPGSIYRARRAQQQKTHPTRRAASTLGGAPVAGGFGASDTGRSWTQDYTLTVNAQTTLLDCLLLIKRTQDPTLAFRYSCGHGMCGSDAVAVNGTPSLMCKTTVAQAAASARPAAGTFRHTGSIAAAVANATTATGAAAIGAGSQQPSTQPTPVIDLAPIAAFSVQRDLIADIDPMLDQIRALQPYLLAHGDLAMTPEGKVNVFEYLQSPEQLAKFEQLTTCIACGVCESSCPVFVGGDAFVGPAALVNQIRFINDSRDGATAERLDAISEADGLPACQSVRACGMNCPQGIDVGEVIWGFIQGVQTRKQEG